MPRTIDWAYVEQRLADKHKPWPKIDETLATLHRIDDDRRDLDAILLAHYYQLLPIQLIADVAGDSYQLAQAAQNFRGGGLVVSATVHFMAEMVKLLSPEKKVVIPSLEASCSIAEGMNADTVRKIRATFPDAAIVGYINSTAAVKAELDASCTSSNARQVVMNIPGDPIIMLPDHYFAQNIFNSIHDGRNYLAYRGIKDGNIVLYDPFSKREYVTQLDGTTAPQLPEGICIVHKYFAPEQVEYHRRVHEVDLVLAHPEVHPDVAAVADHVGGTAAMIKFVGSHPQARRILYLTECDLAAPLMEAYPDREFVTPCFLCPYMKKNTLDAVLASFEQQRYEVTVSPEIAVGAKQSLQRMFELTRF